jgi:uncharacterized protein (DUF2141 family)
MKKTIILAISATLLVTSFVFAEENFTVSGDLMYSTDANICFCLYNQRMFQDWKKTLPPGSFTQTVKADTSGKASFTFQDVPIGEYVIIAFVDENANGKLDYDTWGFIQEPWWMYKQNPNVGMSASWHDVKFEVIENVSGIVIK